MSKIIGKPLLFGDVQNGEMSWLGRDAELINDNVYSEQNTLDNIGWANYTPVEAITTLRNNSAVGSFVADLSKYEYYTIVEYICDYAYGANRPSLNYIEKSVVYYIVTAFRKPLNVNSILNGIKDDASTTASLFTSSFMIYANNNAIKTYSYTTAYGIYVQGAAMVFSSASTTRPTITLRSPVISVRCGTNYFTTAAASAIDAANTKFSIRVKLCRVKRRGIYGRLYDQLVDLANVQLQ